MREFMDDDFLLTTQTAKELYHNTAESCPIIDYHNHLDPKAIYEDMVFDNISDVWLSSDHYKWRAMRTNGIPEQFITGDADPYDKFLAWADTVQNLMGNPLYHWTHLELKRYFGIEKTLSKETAKEIYDECNEKLKTKDFSVRNLLKMQNVKLLCTTDDPADFLTWHLKMKEDEAMPFKVLPTFRPERALGIEKEDYKEYIEMLSKVAETSIDSIDDLLFALVKRLDFFCNEAGCRITDHSLETDFYIPATRDEVNTIFRKRLLGEKTDKEENAKFRGFLLTELGKEYKRRDLIMQLHIGALRNNSERMHAKLGNDAGFDCMNDFNFAPQLSGLLNAMDKEDLLPKTVLYCLNPKDLYMLSTMAGNFQGNEEGIRGKVQLGAAWWFLDHKTGMEKQLTALSDTGMLSTFIGMLTDSRSFLSFPRHEYFRRILCNFIGDMVERGEYPKDEAYLEKLVRDICSGNIQKFLKAFQ